MSDEELADAAQLSSLADETPEGRSIVILAKEKYGIRGREIHEMPHAEFVPFTAQTRMSGLNMNGDRYRKGAADSVRQFIAERGGLSGGNRSVGGKDQPCRRHAAGGRHARPRRWA